MLLVVVQAYLQGDYVCCWLTVVAAGCLYSCLAGLKRPIDKVEIEILLLAECMSCKAAITDVISDQSVSRKCA